MSRRVLAAFVLAAAVAGALWAYRSLTAINPDALAAAETRMWQAYYEGQPQSVYLELVALMREQFGLSRNQAMEVAKGFAIAALSFQQKGAASESEALPLLEAAYAQLKKPLGREFDAARVARAELDWWVARRTPGEDSAEKVGARIAALYALLYGAERKEFRDAGLLRAQAAVLRDRGGRDADWPEVERLLRLSYRRLASGI